MTMSPEFSWPDQFKGAVSLTYDDGLPVHHQLVAPLLNQYNLQASFYPHVNSDLCQHPDRWREIARDGHELGNHSIFHPCRKTDPPQPWLDDHYDLGNYTLSNLRAELEVANLTLSLLDGQTTRSYGSTCGDLTVGRGENEESVKPLLSELFIAARGAPTNQVNQPGDDLDVFNIACIAADGLSLMELKGFVRRVKSSGGWGLFVIHGIGAGSHDLFIEKGIHRQFVEWLVQQQDIWTAPVRTIALYVFHQNNCMRQEFTSNQ